LLDGARNVCLRARLARALDRTDGRFVRIAHGAHVHGVRGMCAAKGPWQSRDRQTSNATQRQESFMKRTKKAVLTGATLAVLGGMLVTSTRPVLASTASVSSVAHQAPTSPDAKGTVYWWSEAAGALAGGAVGGAVGGAISCGPGGAAAGAAAGGVAGFVGYAVSSLFGIAASPAAMDPSTLHALD
jgi:hypothetical protein